jgi:hypothetical protein
VEAMKKFPKRALIIISILVSIIVITTGYLLYGNFSILGEHNRLIYHNPKWKTATLRYEKITYQYPANWKVVDQSQSAPEFDHYCSYPGHDIVTLNAPSGAQITMDAGQICPAPVKASVFGSLPTISFGRHMFMAFEAPIGITPSNPTAATTACLAKTPKPNSTFDFPSKNIYSDAQIVGNKNPYNAFCFEPPASSKDKSASQGVAVTYTPGQIESSPDFNTAKLIFQSMHY